MNFRPSIMSCIGLVPERDSILGTRSASMTMAIVTNPAPARKIAVAVSVRLITNPATAGDTIRVPCQIAELSATALIITFLSIRWGYSACCAG